MALAAYRQVLRSTNIAFRGDPRIFSAARLEARTKFDGCRHLSPGSPESEQKIAEAIEVARILRQNIVQGAQVGGSGEEDQKYQLRIHDEIERGDNASIKKGFNQTASAGGCCNAAA